MEHRPWRFAPEAAERLEDPRRWKVLPPWWLPGMLGLRGHERVVDLGSGTGYFVRALLPYLPEGEVVALDIAPEMHRQLLARLDPEGRRKVLPLLGDVERVPLPDGCAGRVLHMYVLHETRDPAAALREAARLLAPGGRLLVADWRKGAPIPPGPPDEARLSDAAFEAACAATGLGTHLWERRRYTLVWVGEKAG